MTTGKRQSRVIISATCFADADAAIAMATNLAQKVKGDLLGLLVEEESILRHADLPFSKVVAFQSGTPQQVTAKAMAAAFRSDARIFKTNLAKTAMDASLNWSFESRRGRMMSLVHSVAAKGDLVLLGHQQAPVLNSEIVYLNFAGGGEGNFEELANRIAVEMEIPLQVISPVKTGDRQSPETDGTITARHLDQVLEFLRSKSLKAVFVAMRPEQDLDIHKILEAARCPVVYLVQG